jgi:carbonic anhydrase
MDARIDVFGALGLTLGDAHILHNAGGRVTDDVLRSLALSTNVLGVENVAIMQHTGCGLFGVTEEELQSRTRAAVRFLPIDDHTAALRHDIALLREASFLGRVKLITGSVFDLETSVVSELIRWERGR